ncbi:MAG: peptidoglycan DD-metalloendopeptidase family protein [Gemmatimonadota bacterium]|nr:peptidoglycan DD-metalloendopeptidase family protein [Gemmatimonadota bacterium]MDH3367448.1 peptidoglycan DD-metalloendopeptidase family protein [Gemmatimonadota bacterium]MDH3477734.1 peptidoglycan DD-metalloendopeptidase family protein [Gemmatimonadota bacterium]MDH3569748.1 peptidoglycan DD-metalloendopeptidase family protein [Gemmatimonadota bacterium]
MRQRIGRGRPSLVHPVGSARRTNRYLVVWGAVVTLVLSGCGSEPLRELFGDDTPHQRYALRLAEAELDGTALGRDWIAAAESALEKPVTVAAPYREESYLDPREAMAVAYRIPLRNGQRLEVAFESAPDSGYRVFLDLFRAPRDSAATPRRVLSADSLERSLEYLARRDGEYLVRIQPELLRGGRYTITIVVEPSLQFPVSGHDTSAIRSRYGAPRDGGRRRHEGLDIFARRGTPVLAAASGYVRSTRPNNLGGNVIWLRDEMERTHYYAHLDSVVVFRGLAVEVGDTIGFVGNSGNARTTPPHLHFGVYQRGSFDPYPALYQVPTTPEAFSGNPDLIGRVARVSRERTRVREAPSGGSDVVAELARHTPVRVAAGSGPWYRVMLPDGTTGYVATGLTEPLDGPIGRQTVVAGTDLLTEPDPAAVAVDRFVMGTELDVLGVFGSFVFVQNSSGRLGWVSLD